MRHLTHQPDVRTAPRRFLTRVGGLAAVLALVASREGTSATLDDVTGSGGDRVVYAEGAADVTISRCSGLRRYW